jgi:hypothetical protein
MHRRCQAQNCRSGVLAWRDGRLDFDRLLADTAHMTRVPGVAAWEEPRVIPAEQLVSREQAKRELGLRRMATLNVRAALGYVNPAVFQKDATDWGVTRDSLDAEIRWWREAGLRQRALRRVSTWFGIGRRPHWVPKFVHRDDGDGVHT